MKFYGKSCLAIDPREDTQYCLDWMAELVPNILYIDWVCKDLCCDYYGFDKKNHYIAELKSSFGDSERSIIQIIRYYDTFKRSNEFKKYEKEIVLFVLFRGIDVRKFSNMHTLYRDYVKNPNMPKIKFVHRDLENKNVILE